MKNLLIALLCSFAISSTTYGISIGVVTTEGETEFDKSQSPSARLVRALVTLPVIQLSNSVDAYEPSLVRRADFVAVTNTWRLQLHDGALCADGERLLSEDVIFSVQRCLSSNEASFSTEGLSVVSVAFTNEISREESLRQLANCSIYRKRVAEIFGKEFGKATNLVACGPFVIKSSDPVKTVLNRFSSAALSDSVELRSFRDNDAALEQLRIGAIDALLEPSVELLTRVQSDPTLATTECMGMKVVKREDLQFSCKPHLDALTLGYRDEERG